MVIEYHLFWYPDPMQTTIDAAGRIVVPKALRDRLGLRGGAELEITERGGVIEIVPVPTPVSLVETADGLVAVPEHVMPPLSDAMVRDTLEQTRR
jgi:AbrB family looped-hinge helix DNA binding protein